MSLLQYRMRGLEVTERRVITPDERRDLHAKGRRLMHRVWMAAAGVSTVVAVSSELYAHGFLDVPEALAMAFVSVFVGAVDVGTNWPLARRLLRVTGQDEVLDCHPGGPLVGMDRHQRVVAPTGVVIQRNHEDVKTPEAIWVRAVSSLPADVLADIERQIAEGELEGKRVLEGFELWEARKVRDRLDALPWGVFCVATVVLIAVFVDHGLVWVPKVTQAAALWLFSLAFVRSSHVIRDRSPVVARLLANVSVDGRVVRWAEYVNGKLWTVEGAPAPWRTEIDVESKYNIR